MWTPFLDSVGWNVRNDDDKAYLLALLHRTFGVRAPCPRAQGTERFSKRRHLHEELWRPSWIAHWLVPEGTPAFLWFFKRDFDSATTTNLRDGCCCLYIEKHCRDASFLYPRMVYVHVEADTDLFENGGTLIEGTMVLCNASGTHVFLAEDLVADRGRQIAMLPRESASIPLGQRMIQLQTLLDGAIAAHPATDAFVVRMRPSFSLDYLAPSIESLAAATANRLDYGGGRTLSPTTGIVPTGIALRSLIDARTRTIVFRVHCPKGRERARAGAQQAQTQKSSGAANTDTGADAGADADTDADSEEDVDVDSDEDENANEGDRDRSCIRQMFYVRSTHVSDVYELFEDLASMQRTPIASDGVTLAAVPSMDDAIALRGAAASQAPLMFQSNPNRFDGRWVRVPPASTPASASGSCAGGAEACGSRPGARSPGAADRRRCG